MMGQKILRASFAGTALIVLAACQSGGGSSSATASMAAASPIPATPAASTSPASFDTSSTFMQTPAKDASFATLINGVRTSAGVMPVTYNAQLNTAAQDHANDMAANNYFSHIGQNGSTPSDRATAAGYNWTRVTENIAQGHQSEQDVLDGWQNSAGHKANNEDPLVDEFGLGVAGSGADVRWVLMFGKQ